jgi:uncharacterized protein (TIGR02302 family)
MRQPTTLLDSTDRNRATPERMGTGPLERLERRIRLSRLALLWEEIWPRLVPPICLAALILAASWFGLWSLVADGWRLPLVALFAIALLASLAPLARLSVPHRIDAIHRLDRTSGVADRPVGALTDRLPEGTRDSLTRALWEVHRERALAKADAARVVRPRPNVARRDPWRLRAAVALVFVVALTYAGPSAFDRLATAFRGAPVPAPIPPRIDAWVTPPAYTGRPPVFLGGERRGDDAPLTVPAGSVLTLRIDRMEGVTVGLEGQPLAGEEEVAAAGGSRLFRATLAADATLRVEQRGRAPQAWRFAVEPDRTPTIALEGRVQQMVGGALRMRYRLDDDYGIAGAFARFERLRETGPAAPRQAPSVPPRPLYVAPEIPLTLPQARTRSGVGTTTRDMTSHPWAGARVSMTLVARDDAGQEGRSDAVTIELPQRTFEQPLARAVIEQRRALALDAELRRRVATVLDYLTLDPERRSSDSRVYLGLRFNYYRLINARSDDDLREVVDHLWDIAVLIEDGDLSAAQRALRDAQERLEQAIERGASPEELRRLMEELRQALAEVMREMMQQALRDQREGRQRQPDPNERVISQQDLERMMREIEEMMRSGNRDAARNMMSQLRDMLQALRNARPSMQGQNGGGQQMLDELGNMIREQQRLMDRTFRERQQGRRQQQPGQGQQRQQQGQRQPGQGQQGQGQPGDGEPGEGEGMQDLQRGQQALRDQLQRFMDQLRQGGRDPNRQLGDADGQMGEAEQQLGRRNPGDALGPQSRALDNLRRGAQQMARDQMGQGEGDPNGMPGPGQGQANNQRRPNMNDPLQRSIPPDEQTSSDVRIPDRVDRQRAQEILEDVRRRLSDPSRPPIEMEYLQRLLRPF